MADKTKDKPETKTTKKAEVVHIHMARYSAPGEGKYLSGICGKKDGQALITRNTAMKLEPEEFQKLCPSCKRFAMIPSHSFKKMAQGYYEVRSKETGRVMGEVRRCSEVAWEWRSCQSGWAIGTFPIQFRATMEVLKHYRMYGGKDA